MKISVYGLLILLLSFACVPNKKRIYLQTAGVEEGKEIPTDSIIRILPLESYEYQLQPGDIVSVKISSLTDPKFNFFSDTEKELKEGIDPSLSGFLLDKDGFIELPVAGKVNLAGLTMEDAQNRVRDLARNYLESPTVNLRLLSFHYTVLGEVNQPGKYTTYSGRFTIMDAIGRAGDLTDVADRKHVKIVRREKGEAKIYFMDLLDANAISSKLFYLKPNDLVYVQPLKAKNFRQFQAPNLVLILSALTSITLLFFRI